MNGTELLVKCLELTSSDQDGEALAATRKANLIRRRLGKSWDELLHDQSAGAQDFDLATTETHKINWPAVFAFIREWNPPTGSYAKFFDSVEAQFDRKASLTPKQRRAVLKFYSTAVEVKRDFEEG